MQAEVCLSFLKLAVSRFGEKHEITFKYVKDCHNQAEVCYSLSKFAEGHEILGKIYQMLSKPS